MVIRLVEVPLLLSFWGAQLYGEWLILFAIPAYLSMADGGFVGVTCHEMTMQSAAGNREKALVLYQSTWAMVTTISIIAISLTCSVVQFIPWHRWLNFSLMGAKEVMQTLLIVVIHVFTGFQGGLLNSGFWMAGAYANGMYLMAVTQALEFLIFAIVILLGGRPVHAALGLLSGRLIGTIIMYIGQRRITPWLQYGISKASFHQIKRLFIPAITSLAFPLGNAFNIQGVRIVIGFVLGPSAVALFVPLRTLSRLALQPENIIIRLAEPELALAYGSGDSLLFQRLFSRSCQLAFWGCMLLCLCLVFFGQWVFHIWTNANLAINYPVYFLLLGSALIHGIWHTALMVPYSTNRHKHVSMSYVFFYGVVVFGLAYIGTVGLGLCGTAITIFSIEVLMAILVVKNALLLADISIFQWLKAILKPPLATT